MATPEQAEMMKGKTVLILSHSKWNPGKESSGLEIATLLRFSALCPECGEGHIEGHMGKDGRDAAVL